MVSYPAELLLFFSLFDQVSCKKSSPDLSKLHNCLYIFLLYTAYIPTLKTINRTYWYSMWGKVSKLDEHILYTVLSLPRTRRFLNLRQSKSADGKLTELLSPFLLESNGRPWQTTVWKWLCPKDSTIIGLLVATFSTLTDETAMACQKGRIRNLEFRALSVPWNLKRSRNWLISASYLAQVAFSNC